MDTQAKRLLILTISITSLAAFATRAAEPVVGTRTVLWFSTQFPDVTTSPSEQGLMPPEHMPYSAQIASDFFREASYGKLDVVFTTVPDYVVFPEPMLPYFAEGTFALWGRILELSPDALRPFGLSMDDFDFVVISMPYVGQNPRGFAGGGRVHIAGAWTQVAGTLIHELGHCLGMNHATATWGTGDNASNIIAEDERREYGDEMSVMGGSANWVSLDHATDGVQDVPILHMPALMKSALGWIDPESEMEVTSSRIVRIFRHDRPSASGILLARFRGESGLEFGVDLARLPDVYEAILKTLPGWQDWEMCQPGVAVRISESGGRRTRLLDVDPCNPVGTAGSLMGFDDCTLDVGDPTVELDGVKLTVLDSGGGELDRWYDLYIDLDDEASRPVLAVDWDGTDCVVSFDTQAGYRYDVEASGDFLNWTKVIREVPGTGDRQSIAVSPEAVAFTALRVSKTR